MENFITYIVLFIKSTIENIINLLTNWAFITLTIFLFLRKTIIDFINRINSIKTANISLKMSDITNAQNKLDKNNVKSLSQNQNSTKNNRHDFYNQFLKNPDYSNTLKARYNYIAETSEIDKTKITNDDDIKFLLECLTDYSLALLFERIYNIIFRSQAKALMYLYTEKNNNTKIPEEKIKSYYDEAYSLNPIFYNTFKYENWFRFLKTMSLINKSDDGSVSITDDGKAFCRYIINQNYNIDNIYLL